MNKAFKLLASMTNTLFLIILLSTIKKQFFFNLNVLTWIMFQHEILEKVNYSVLEVGTNKFRFTQMCTCDLNDKFLMKCDVCEFHTPGICQISYTKSTIG